MRSGDYITAKGVGKLSERRNVTLNFLGWGKEFEISCEGADGLELNWGMVVHDAVCRTFRRVGMGAVKVKDTTFQLIFPDEMAFDLKVLLSMI